MIYMYIYKYMYLYVSDWAFSAVSCHSKSLYNFIFWKSKTHFSRLFTNPNPNIVKIHIDIVYEHIDKHIQSIYAAQNEIEFS